MIITELIKNQVYECLIMLLAGLFVGFFREVFAWICIITNRWYMKSKSKEVTAFRDKVRKIARIAGEVLFWSLSGIVVCGFLYYCCYGEPSFHTFCAFCLGVFLWEKIFYGMIG